MQECTVFVSNLNNLTTPNELLNIFAEFGKVKNAHLVKGSIKGKKHAKNVGFIKFAQQQGADNAIEMGSLEIDDRIVKITAAKAKPPSTTIIIHGIPDDVTEDEILSKFEDWNPADIAIIKRNSLREFGFGVVRFATVEEKDAALAARKVIIIGGAESKVETSKKNYKSEGSSED